MLNKFFNRYIRTTHFWRSISFAEMAQLYVSRMIRIMALQIVSGFSVVYIYQLGYSLTFIAVFLAGYFLLRIFMAPLVALTVAHFGPKRSSLISNIAQIAAAFLIITLPELGPWILLAYAPVAGYARSLYDLSFIVDFSKVKNVQNSGKELGLMRIIERVMIGLGPLLGGLVAIAFGAQVMMVFGAFLLLVSALPLFFSGEPTKTRQRITLRNFNWKAARPTMIASVGAGVDTNISGLIWVLFMAIAIFGVAGNNSIYAEVGGIATISIFASLAVSYAYGKIVDKKQGKTLLKYSVYGNIAVSLSRPFASTAFHALSIAAVNEVTTTGYSIPSTRAVFDTADGLPGYRIVYLAVTLTLQILGDFITSVVFFFLTLFMGEILSMQALFFIMTPFLLLHLYYLSSLYKGGILTKFIHRV